MFLDNLFPKVIRSQLIDDDERTGEYDDADGGIDNRVNHVSKLDAHLLASCVVMVTAVDGTVRAGIVAHRPWNVLNLVDRVETPAAVFGGAERAEHDEAVQKIQVSHH